MSNEKEIKVNEANCELPDDEMNDVSGGEIIPAQGIITCPRCNTECKLYNKKSKCPSCGFEFPAYHPLNPFGK